MDIPISAHGGCLCLFAFGPRPLFVVVVFLFRFVGVGRRAYLTGGCAFLPYALWFFVFLPPLFMYSLQGSECVSVLFSVSLISLRTEPLSVIGRTRGKKAGDNIGSAGFPQFNAQVPVPPPAAKADPPLLPVAALGSEKAYNEIKGKNKELEKGGKGDSLKGGNSDKGKGKEFDKGAKGDQGDKGAQLPRLHGTCPGERERKKADGKRTVASCSQGYEPLYKMCTHVRRATRSGRAEFKQDTRCRCNDSWLQASP